MKLTGDPANCFAVLVGIEQYGAPFPALRGPAMDALRLADWLLQQGVPGERLRLLVNYAPISDATQNAAREALHQKLAAAGAIFAEPLRQLIDHALEPANLPLAEGAIDGLLLLYFSGHGVCPETSDHRLLMTADASGDSAEAVNLELQARRLRQNVHSRRFSQQWLILDACGDVVDEDLLGFYKPTAKDKNSAGAAQFCLCSALRGERSYVAKDAQESLFTAALLRLLAGRALAGLDLEQLYVELGSAFRDSKQHPSLWRRNERHEIAALPLGRISAAPATASLIETLNSLPVHIDLLLGVYAEITADHTSRPPQAGTLVQELDSRVGAHASGLRNIELFAVRLAARCSTLAGELNKTGVAGKVAAAAEFSAAAAQLDAWLADHAGNQPALTAERKRLAQSSARNNLHVVILDPGDANTPARAWAERDQLIDLPESLDSAGPLLQRLHLAVTHLHNAGRLAGNCRLELVIPLKALQEAFIGEQIEVDRDLPLTLALGDDSLKVTVRLRERWTQLNWHKGWRTRWEHCQPALIQRPQLHWGKPALDSEAEGWRWIGAGQSSELTRQLYNGEPFAAWSCNAAPAQLQVHFEQHSYDQLGSLLTALARFNRNGEFVTCIVDDFDRIPLGASPLLEPLEQPR